MYPIWQPSAAASVKPALALQADKEGATAEKGALVGASQEVRFGLWLGACVAALSARLRAC